MRIVHIDTGKDFRGGQDLLLSLARGLKRRDHRQLIVCPEGRPLARAAAGEELEVAGLESSSRLRRRLRAEPFDIVHAHDGKAQNISFLASAGLPVRRVASRLVAFRPRHPLIHRWKYSHTCHGVIALSQSVRQVLIDAGVPAAHVEVIVAGIDMPKELPTPEMRARARARFGYSNDQFVVGHVAAFTHEKGQDVALAAALRLAPKLARARMILAGDGPERLRPPMVELTRQASGIAQLPGFVDDLDEFYAALDVFIMPSRSEAWGLTALRAMAFGLPVVASNVEGLCEIIEHGKTGLLVRPSDAQALVEAVVAMVKDHDFRLRAAEFGRKKVVEEFDIDKEASKLNRYLLDSCAEG